VLAAAVQIAAVLLPTRFGRSSHHHAIREAIIPKLQIVQLTGLEPRFVSFAAAAP
jgi:hypothetical protein